MFNLRVAWILRLQLRLIAAAFQGRGGDWTDVSGEEAAAPERHPAGGGGGGVKSVWELYVDQDQRLPPEDWGPESDWNWKNKRVNSRWWEHNTVTDS